MGRKKTILENEWSKLFSRKVEDFLRERKLTRSEIGIRMGFSKNGLLMRVKRLLDGDTQRPPEIIEDLAKALSWPLTAGESDYVSSENVEKIEATLAVYSGQQMPSLCKKLTLPALEDTLMLIAELSRFSLRSAPRRAEGSPLKDTSSLPREASESEGLCWKLFRDELTQLLTMWHLILGLEKEYVRLRETKDEGTTSLDILLSRWRAIEKTLSQLSSPLQEAYARYMWAHILALNGATNNSGYQAEQSWNKLKELTYESDGINQLKFLVCLVRGDNEREKGSLVDALNYYDRALQALPDQHREDKNRQRVILKKFNTYLGFLLEPPSDLMQEVYGLGREEQNPEIKARALYALAWYRLSKRGREIANSVDDIRSGINCARKLEDAHLEAVGNQYLGDSLFRLGKFTDAQAHFEFAKRHYQGSHHMRLGVTCLSLGRLHAYQGLIYAMNNNFRRWEIEMHEANDSFKQAENAFYKALNVKIEASSAHKVKQLLIERAKWDAIEAVVQMNDFSRGREPSEKISNARRKLDEANQREWGERTDFLNWASHVNSCIVDYIEWFLYHPDDNQHAAKIEAKVREELAGIKESPKSHKELPEVRYFSSIFDGHSARLYAILGALRWKMGLKGKHGGEEDIVESARLAIKDMMAVLDCRWIISLVLRLEDLENTFDNKLKHGFSERLGELLNLYK